MSKLTGSNLGSPGGSPDLQLFRKACLTYCQHVAPERMTRRVAARPPGQRLCKTLLSRLARFGSNQRGCHRPSSTQYQKRPPLMVTFPGMARPRGLLAASRLALRASVFARRCCLAWPGSARTEEVVIGPQAPNTKKGHLKGDLSWYGAPERIRTSDTRLRKPVLYPAELRARGKWDHTVCSGRSGSRAPIRQRHRLSRAAGLSSATSD